MRKLSEELLVALAIFLPWHGAITVFFPEEFRFWKEIILGILFFVAVLFELRSRYIEKSQKPFSWSEVFAFLFLVWLTALAFLNEDPTTAFLAVRYLGTGFAVFIIVSRILKHFATAERVMILSRFAVALISSAVLAVLFGVWMKYLGGIEILKNFYSPTISSWVPGQRVPIFHEAGEFIRMQGGSSGPIEFAHMLLAGAAMLFLLPMNPKYKRIILAVLLFGIFQSFSRVVTVLAVAGILLYIALQYREHLKKVALGMGAVVLLGLGILFTNQTLYQNFFERAGSSEHVTRPLEALGAGLYRPLTGNLGKLGPAARAKNLKEYNDDKAMIAENVFLDYFAQSGIIGFILAILFFCALFSETTAFGWAFLGFAALSANAATVFDMTPVSILFFLIFAFFSSLDTIKLRISI